MKIEHTKWDKIFANEATDNRFTSKIYKHLMQIYIKNNLIKK